MIINVSNIHGVDVRSGCELVWVPGLVRDPCCSGTDARLEAHDDMS